MKILLVEDIHEAGKQYLIERGYEVVVAPDRSVETVKNIIADYDGVITRSYSFPAEIIENASKLKVIGRFGIGVEHIDVEAATKLGIYVTNAPTAGVNSVAEHTASMILALAKRTIESDKATRNGYWNFRNEHLSSDLEGKVLGVVALGRIGQLVAEKMYHGFGMKVIGYDPYISKTLDFIEMVSLEGVYRNADFVTLHLPSTPETDKSVNSNVFDMMKESAYLINAARGSIINEKDLIDALKNKKIAGAGIDVFSVEPPNIENELFKFDNVVLTPHYASLSKEAAARLAIHAAQGVDEVLTGKTPTWAVNKPELS